MSTSVFVGHGIGWVWRRLAVTLPLAAWLAFAVWAPGIPGEALSEARARAESVLPVEDDADSS